jgi:hypothetical protein
VQIGGTRDIDNDVLTMAPLFSSLVIPALVLILSGPAGARHKDALTGLPLYPGVTSPQSLPKTAFCGQQMQGTFYLIMGFNVEVMKTWYAEHLTGFHAYHAVSDGRTLDTFFNADGTKEITITASHGTAGEVFSISYGRFEPGLSQSQMASFNRSEARCE